MFLGCGDWRREPNGTAATMMLLRPAASSLITAVVLGRGARLIDRRDELLPDGRIVSQLRRKGSTMSKRGLKGWVSKCDGNC